MTSRIDIFDRSRGGPGGEQGGPLGDFERSCRAVPVRRRALEIVSERLGGESVRDGSSSVFRVEYRLPKRSFHGCVEFELIDRLDPGLLKVLFPRTAGAGLAGNPARGCTAFGDLVFFDIETTGLSGGAGTLVFLAGVVRVLDTEILLTQYFLENLSSERLFLTLLNNELGSGRALVSYNGRCFDSTIIKNRLIVNGFRPAEPGPLHFDLLYPSRRIWKGRLPDFSLQTVERGVLRVEREGDIPGYRIPDIFFQYLRGDGTTLHAAAQGTEGQELYGVFIHNRLDSLSLLALLVRQLSLIGVLVGSGEPEAGDETLSGDAAGVPCDFTYNPAALSDMLVSGDRSGEARRFLQRHSGDTEALRRLGSLCKRERLHADACAAFTGLLRRARGLLEYVFACTELAKICEHGLKDIRAAKGYAEMAMRRIERAGLLSTGERGSVERERQDLRKRLARLERRAGTP